MMGRCFYVEVLIRGPGDHLPRRTPRRLSSRAASLTHKKKKKKKKWREAEVGPDHYFHVVPARQPPPKYRDVICAWGRQAKGGCRKLVVLGHPGLPRCGGAADTAVKACVGGCREL